MVQSWFINLKLMNKVGIASQLEESLHPLQKAALKAGLPLPSLKIIDAVEMASKQVPILPDYFIIALMHSESGFDPKATSKKNYKGLMQIPFAIYYEDVNVLIGARIFKEKLKITDGDFRKAITIYKGWPVNHPEGKRQADKVLMLARKIKESV
jgi:soluble lytic murein transglycosylase-like protein